MQIDIVFSSGVHSTFLNSTGCTQTGKVLTLHEFAIGVHSQYRDPV